MTGRAQTLLQRGHDVDLYRVTLDDAGVLGFSSNLLLVDHTTGRVMNKDVPMEYANGRIGVFPHPSLPRHEDYETAYMFMHHPEQGFPA